MLTNGSDVSDVFPLSNVNDVKDVFPQCPLGDVRMLFSICFSSRVSSKRYLSYPQLEALQELNRVVNDYVELRRQSRGGLHEALCNQAFVARENADQVNLQELGAGAANELLNANNQDEQDESENQDKKEGEKPKKQPTCDQLIRNHYSSYREKLANKSSNAGLGPCDAQGCVLSYHPAFRSRNIYPQ